MAGRLAPAAAAPRRPRADLAARASALLREIAGRR